MNTDKPVTLLPAITLLCVDDEPGILAALERLLRQDGYRILCADSGNAGLEIMAHEPVDIVISDMLMPAMNGAEFLAQVRARWPRTLRIVMTGHASLASTIAAINKGEIFHYIAKPWDDAALRITIRHAAERQLLSAERLRLEALTLQKNDELQALNASLEKKVAERTAQVLQEHRRVLVANEKLKAGFSLSIKVFSNLIEMSDPLSAGHSRRVAHTAKRIAEKLALDRSAIQDIVIAALLHDIGKLTLPESVRRMPLVSMNAEDLALYKSHAVKGELALLAIPELRTAARLIRAHHERFDGLGFPDGLSGSEIPLGAAILAVANDYDTHQISRTETVLMAPGEAQDVITAARGKRYAPVVVDAFLSQAETGISGQPSDDHMVLRELALTADQLEPGMILSRDLISGDGLLLLAADIPLDDELIGMIRESRTFPIHVDGDSIRP